MSLSDMGIRNKKAALGFAIFYFILSAESRAESDWYFYGSTDKATHYLDTTRIVRQGKKVNVWDKENLGEGRSVRLANGNLYRSGLANYDVDCGNRTLDLRATFYYEQNDLQGDIAFSASYPGGSPKMVPPDSIGEELANAVCERLPPRELKVDYHPPAFDTRSWQFLWSTDILELYVNRSTFVRQGRNEFFWVLENAKGDAEINKGNPEERSEIMHWVINCETKTMQVLERFTFSGPSATGENLRSLRIDNGSAIRLDQFDVSGGPLQSKLCVQPQKPTKPKPANTPSAPNPF